jgi:hypothetical protein
MQEDLENSMIYQNPALNSMINQSIQASTNVDALP